MFPNLDIDVPQTGVLPTSCPETDYWQTFVRAVETTKQLIKRHDGENILLVSHGGPVCCIAPSLSGWKNWEAKPYLAAITKLHRPSPDTKIDEWILEKNADTSHLTHVAI